MERVCALECQIQEHWYLEAVWGNLQLSTGVLGTLLIHDAPHPIAAL